MLPELICPSMTDGALRNNQFDMTLKALGFRDLLLHAWYNSGNWPSVSDSDALLTQGIGRATQVLYCRKQFFQVVCSMMVLIAVSVTASKKQAFDRRRSADRSLGVFININHAS